MKKCMMVSGTVLGIVLMTMMPGAAPISAAGTLEACELLTKVEAEALFNETVWSQRAGKVSAPAGNNCTYFFKKKGGTFSVKLKVSSSEEIKNEGIFKSARDIFDRQKKARMANENTAKQLKSVAGLGDEAFWNGFDLWIVKGDYLVNIFARSPLEGSFKNKEAMEKARADQDLDLSRKVAAKVLPKVK